MFKRKQVVLPPKPLSLEEIAAQKAKKQVEENVRNNAIEWIYASPNSVFSEIFTNMIEDVTCLGGDNLSAFDEENTRAYLAVLQKLEAISKTWFQIDRHTLAREQAVQMYNYLNSRLISTVRTLVMESHSRGISYAYNRYDGPHLAKNLSELFTELYTIRNNQETQFYSTEILGRPQVVIATGTKVANIFPKIKTSNKELNTTLLHLEDLWIEASSKKNSIEDEYILEEIANHYLPDAANLYSTFKLAKPEYQQQAELIILEQVKLLETRIQAILNLSFKAALLALSTQTEFLKTKVPEEIEAEAFKIRTIV